MGRRRSTNKKSPEKQTATTLGPRPIRSQAEQDPKLFSQLADFVITKRGITLAQLASEIGVDKSTLWRQIAACNVKPDDREALLRYIYDAKQALTDKWRQEARRQPHPLFYSLLEFFAIPDTPQDNARAALSGTFELWRKSVQDENEYVHGKVIFTHNEENEVLSAAMIQRKKERGGAGGGEEHFDGYLVRVSNIYMMMLGDAETHDPRVTFFPWHYPGRKGNRTLNELHGFTLGRDGAKTFFSPVLLNRVEGDLKVAALDKKLDVVQENKVPMYVRRQLNRYPFLTM